MASDPPTTRFSAYRNLAGWHAAAARAWQRRWVKALAVLAVLVAIGYAVLWLTIIRELPSVDRLRAYEPPLPTNVRGIDGVPVQSYARERRVELSYAEYPPLLIRAFLAAEDKSFFEHHGVDYTGAAGAVFDYARKLGTGKRARGGSTITQQVAKNLLIGNEYSPTRKLKEAILAYKIEDTLTKPQILELYLNQIALGRNSFGVEAASHAYFDKELPELDLAQMAYLAILPKGPSNYDPVRHADRALQRRNYVLGEMLKNGFINRRPSTTQAVAEPIGTILRRTPKFEAHGGYFVEEVRRELIDKFGETADGGRQPFSVYEGGLWVRTSLDTRLQDLAAQALRDGLLRYDRGRGWGGPIDHRDIDGSNWQQALLNTNIALDYSDWRVAIVIAKAADAAQLGFATGETGTLPRWGAQMPVRGVGGTAFAASRRRHHRRRARRRAVRAARACRASRAGSSWRSRRRRACWRCRAASTRGCRRSTAPPRRAAAGIDHQADRLFRRAGQRHDARLDHRRRAVLRRSGRASGAPNASRTSATRAARGRTPCAGGSSSRAT